TGVDVHDRRARVGGTLRLLGDVDWGVRDRRTLVSRRQHPGQRGADDDRVARRGCHTGMLPCLRQGLSTFLPRACSIPLMITRRVSDGSITSSIIAQPAARYGVICARIVSTSFARVASGSSDASTCLLKMMLTAPSGPMTEISANGHATIASGWYPLPHIT